MTKKPSPQDLAFQRVRKARSRVANLSKVPHGLELSSARQELAVAQVQRQMEVCVVQSGVDPITTLELALAERRQP